LNDSDPNPEKRISPTDRTQRLVAAVSYQLPFGKNQMYDLHSRFANLVAGGWVVNTVMTFQTGAPITWVNGSTTSPGDYVYFGGGLNVDPRQVNGPAFNTAAFDTKSTEAFNYHLRTFPTTFGNVRADGINQIDASVMKRVEFAERKSVEVRVEAFNLPNHAIFAAPNTTASSSGFGLITATANRFRTIQLGARIVF
jgi:hypothetical protein